MSVITSGYRLLSSFDVTSSSRLRIMTAVADRCLQAALGMEHKCLSSTVLMKLFRHRTLTATACLVSAGQSASLLFNFGLNDFGLAMVFACNLGRCATDVISYLIFPAIFAMGKPSVIGSPSVTILPTSSWCVSAYRMVSLKCNYRIERDRSCAVCLGPAFCDPILSVSAPSLMSIEPVTSLLPVNRAATQAGKTIARSSLAASPSGLGCVSGAIYD
jgi:hypothetical protein